MATVTKTIHKTTGDYSTIAAWEAATNLNSGADIWKGVISDAAAYDEAVTINAGGTGTSSYIWLTADSAVAHAGVAGTGHARMNYTGTATDAIEIASSFVRVDWLEIQRSGGSFGNSDEAIRVSSGADDVLIDYCILWAATSTQSDTDGIYIGASASNPVNVSNSVIYGWVRGGIHLQQFSGNNTVVVNADHNTVAYVGQGTDEAPYNLNQAGTATSTLNTYNSVAMGRISGTNRDIHLFAQNASSVCVLAGSHNAVNSVTTAGAGTNTQNQTSSVAATDGVVDSAPATAGVYVTDYTGVTTFDFTPVDHANNVILEAGTNRQGSDRKSVV